MAGRLLGDVRSQVGTLLVTAEKATPADKLVKELCKLCKKQGLEYGLWVKRVAQPGGEDQRQQMMMMFASGPGGGEQKKSALGRPVEIYKVYAKDGRLEPVRELQFSGLSAGSLKSIVAAAIGRRSINLFSTTFMGSIGLPPVLSPGRAVDGVALQASKEKKENPACSPSLLCPGEVGSPAEAR